MEINNSKYFELCNKYGANTVNQFSRFFSKSVVCKLFELFETTAKKNDGTLAVVVSENSIDTQWYDEHFDEVCEMREDGESRVAYPIYIAYDIMPTVGEAVLEMADMWQETVKSIASAKAA